MADMHALCWEDFGFYPEWGEGRSPRGTVSGGGAGADVSKTPTDPALGLNDHLLPMNFPSPGALSLGTADI